MRRIVLHWKKIKMGISENIRNLRIMADYSQVYLARLLGVNKSTVRAWENGAQKPNSDNICRLSKIFKISSDELLDLTDNRKMQEFSYEFDKCGGITISDLMEENGISRSRLAAQLDVTPKTVINWETKGITGIRNCQKLIRLFDLDKDTFMELI